MAKRRPNPPVLAVAAPGRRRPKKSERRKASAPAGPSPAAISYGGLKGTLAADLAADRRTALAILVLALCVGAVLRLWLSFTDDGIAWPDEIYQSLEPGHR